MIIYYWYFLLWEIAFTFCIERVHIVWRNKFKELFNAWRMFVVILLFIWKKNRFGYLLVHWRFSCSFDCCLIICQCSRIAHKVMGFSKHFLLVVNSVKRVNLNWVETQHIIDIFFTIIYLTKKKCIQM